MREARKQIDGVIAKLKQKTQAMADEARGAADHTGASGAARREARAAVDAVASTHPRTGPGSRVAAPQPAPPRHGRSAPGSIVGGFGLEGVVMSLHDGMADVDVRGKRMRANVRDLRVAGCAGRPAPKVNVHVELQPRESTSSELNVIGCTVDEALTRAERFMDESMLTDQRRSVSSMATARVS